MLEYSTDMTLYSRWGKQVNIRKPLPDYPRMYLQRNSFYALNGLWEYQITERKAEPDPSEWKQICVPFPLGSVLSGSEEQLMPGKALWYRKHFAFHPDGMEVHLNFEAVDCIATVYLNGKKAGRHVGGYEPFSVDVTSLISYQNALMVRVIDDSDHSIYARGKQAVDHGGMFYTPQSGIWGTVWMEKVPAHAVRDLKITPDYDHAKVRFDLAGKFSQAAIVILDQGEPVHSGITNDMHYEAEIPHMHAWSPEDPHLYDVIIRTEDDIVRSYFGMRKFSKGRDSHGILRFMLNDRPYFASGVLDQGYTCDGGYTYPSEDQMRTEISTLKDMGFNMIRKHAKVENRRWYYLCDSLGMLVMQDMPSGGYDHWDSLRMGFLPTIGFRKRKDTGNTPFGRVSKKSEIAYGAELDGMIHELYDAPCIFAWVPFNEGWGQFDAEKVTRHIRGIDETRLVDSASGWFDQGCGDFESTHDYFFPYHARPKKKRIQMLTEFGGFSYVEPKHSAPQKLYGYRKYTDRPSLDEAVMNCYEEMVLNNIEKGLSGCVFTQLADIEDECNGLFTADRAMLKIDAVRMKKINEKIRRVMNDER